MCCVDDQDTSASVHCGTAFRHQDTHPKTLLLSYSNVFLKFSIQCFTYQVTVSAATPEWTLVL